MRFSKLIAALVLLIAVGGFTYLAVMDVPIDKKQITKTISNERFFSEE